MTVPLSGVGAGESLESTLPEGPLNEEWEPVPEVGVGRGGGED